MEETNKLVKVYSNQSKKARLKRNKNKFQRIWDAEKQTYVKIRKAKYPVRNKQNKKDWREIDDSSAIERRQNTSKKPKSVSVTVQEVQKPETKQHVRKEPARKKATTVKIGGVKHIWDSQTLHYKRAALY